MPRHLGVRFFSELGTVNPPFDFNLATPSAALLLLFLTPLAALHVR